MNWRCVHLGFNPKGSGDVSYLQFNFNSHLEAHLTQTADWYRYGSQNYVVYTNATLDQLVIGIRTLPGFQNIYLFISELDARYWGWMPPAFWTWLQEHQRLSGQQFPL
jgi:hypothetical protein